MSECGMIDEDDDWERDADRAYMIALREAHRKEIARIEREKLMLDIHMGGFMLTFIAGGITAIVKTIIG